MDANLSGLAVLAIVALLSVAVVEVMLLARHRRDLERELNEAHATILVLHARLDEATRPPAEFARMRLRRLAIDRFVRLRLAAPRHLPLTDRRIS